MSKKILVLGAGGFIGTHQVEYLKSLGHWVCGVDLKYPMFSQTAADRFIIGDLRDTVLVESIFSETAYDEVYQFAADMGGAEFIFTGENDANIMHNSCMINLNVLAAATKYNTKNILYTSSACIYPKENQEDPNNPQCAEYSAYPANPDSDYGWEKLYSERLYLAFQKNYGINVKVARLHNIYGPLGTWQGGREKAPAALCRKVADASENGVIDVIGTGKQTRSFLYIDDCIKGLEKLMHTDCFHGPINIGSEEMVTIEQLATKIIQISNKNISIRYIDGPTGVNGRNSCNDLARKEIGWDFETTLEAGLRKTYAWIKDQVTKSQL